MKKIIIAIERAKFNYLYKYNACFVSRENVIECSFSDLMESCRHDVKSAAITIEKSLPFFESEHEVFLIEVDLSEVRYNLEFNFNAVLRIIPFNKTAMELLQSKLNSDFHYAPPLSDALYEEIVSLREHNLRSSSALTVLYYFELTPPAESFCSLIRSATRRIILNTDMPKDATTIDFLLSFDTTPSGIPSGNVEGLMKVICIGLLKINHNIDNLRKSPLFNLLLDKSEDLNQGSLLNCYQRFQEISNENTDHIEKLMSILDMPSVTSEIFFFLFLFMSLKKKVQSNEFDLSSINSDVRDMEKEYSAEVSQALYLIGYTMSMACLHESIHRLSFAPLFDIENKNTYPNEVSKVNIIAPRVQSIQGIHTVNNDSSSSDLLNIDDKAEVNAYADNDGKGFADIEQSDFSGLGESLEKFDKNERETFLENAKKLKGRDSKNALNLVNDLYELNPSFDYFDLEKRIKNDTSCLKADKSFKKAYQDLLNEFNGLK